MKDKNNNILPKYPFIPKHQTMYFQCPRFKHPLETRKNDLKKQVFCVFCGKFHEKHEMQKMKADRNGILQPLQKQEEKQKRKYERVKGNAIKEAELRREEMNLTIKRLAKDYCCNLKRY